MSGEPDDLFALGLAPPPIPAPDPAQGYDTATEYEAVRRHDDQP